MPLIPVEPAAVDDDDEQLSLFRRVGTFLPLMIVLGITLPIMIYISLMEFSGWNVPVFGANSVWASVAGTSNNIILYTAPSSKTYFSAIGGNYETLLLPWRTYFENRKLRFQEVQEVNRIHSLKSGVLILPSAAALSNEERTEILAFHDRGGSVLTTWATGTRNGKGDWEGWQFLAALGVKMNGEIPASAEANHLIVTGASPVSNTLESGHRIWMSKTSETLLRFEGKEVAGRFMNWARVVDDERRGEGAIVFSEAAVSAARTVSYAFSESAWESHPLAAYALIDDTIQWLRHEPVMVRAAWPQAKRAAQIFEMDTEEGFANALSFGAMMQSINYRATFYVLTSVAKVFPEILARLARDFEVGFHADVHDGFKGQPEDLQEKRIKAMRSDLETALVSTQGMTGFRAPTESYDETTERILQKNGIRHHTADPGRTDSRLPLIAKLDDVKPEDSLVVLPRTQRDDINLYWEKLSPEQTTKALIDDFELTAELGSLGLLSVHSQNFAEESVLTKAMPGFLEYVKQHRAQVWLASAGQVADWWRSRDRFKLSSSNKGKRVEFNVSVTGKTPVPGASIILMLPQKGVQVVVKSLKVGQAEPTIAPLDEYRSAIVFDLLSPGDYAYQASFSAK